MKVLITRFALFGLLALTLLASVHPAAAAQMYNYTFESGSLSPWIVGADPGVPNHSLTVQNGDSFCPGTKYANLQAGAPFMPNSGVWMFSRYVTGAHPITVQVRFAVKNKLNCPTCRAMVRIGDGPVSSSAQFVAVGPIASTTWTVYTYAKSFTPASGVVGVAVGWIGAPAAFPANVAFDCIDVSITP